MIWEWDGKIIINLRIISIYLQSLTVKSRRKHISILGRGICLLLLYWRIIIINIIVVVVVAKRHDSFLIFFNQTTFDLRNKLFWIISSSPDSASSVCEPVLDLMRDKYTSFTRVNFYLFEGNSGFFCKSELFFMRWIRVLEVFCQPVL